MADLPTIPWRFLSYAESELEELPEGRTHHWFVRPNTAQSESLAFVRAQLAPGSSHGFHHHPEMDEIIYILAGEAVQWVEEEKRTLGEWWYSQEYGCAFLDAETAAFRQADIDRAFSDEVEVWDLSLSA